MIYKVKPNDTLSKIAQHFAIPLPMLLAFNRDIKNPNNIFVGQDIQIPNVEDVPDGGTFTTPTDRNDLVERARTAIGKRIRYKLGAGGMKPTSPLPADSNNQCDCSGFICWVLGLSRKSNIPFYKKLGGWIFTDSMESDIKSSAGIFERITTPEVGCIVVYGAGNQIGHVGMVSQVSNGKMAKVIHCSSGNDKRTKDSIQETSPAVFDRADALWGRYAPVV